jgi:hypothetical protein
MYCVFVESKGRAQSVIFFTDVSGLLTPTSALASFPLLSGGFA